MAKTKARIHKRSPVKSRLKILFVASEAAPLVRTGGLGDVAGALPKALHAQGHDVRVAIPGYSGLPPEATGEQVCMCVVNLGAKTVYGSLRKGVLPDTSIPLYLVEHAGYFNREAPYGAGGHDYHDNIERFSFFTMALLHGIAQTDWRPDVVHCNDWHTSTLPAHLATRFARNDTWGGMPSVFTIHNLAYQGRYDEAQFGLTGLDRDLFSAEGVEFFGQVNLMKAGIAFASKINTVSPRYAVEIQTSEYGEGLDGFLSHRKDDLSGILNGVDYDEWNPATDPHLPAQYMGDDMAGKLSCKRALQERYNLPQIDVPVFGLVSRFAAQKGLDLVLDSLDRVMAHDLQLILLGTGDPSLCKALLEASLQHHSKMRVEIAFDSALSHLIEAGCDFFLMPSRFEPCGLSQLYSLAYGTVPVVRRTGGLADSVVDITAETLSNRTATGILFEEATAEALASAVDRAVRLYADTPTYRKVQHNGMSADFSWDRSSEEYVALYREAIANP